jgi:hypothetical protein
MANQSVEIKRLGEDRAVATTRPQRLGMPKTISICGGIGQDKN